MIVSLEGEVMESSTTSVVLDVAGVGYTLGISGNTYASLPLKGSVVRLFVRMVVRQDDISLYGFSSKEERILFDKLTGISGVGPKLCLAILSAYTPHQLATIVASDDIASLKAIKGVGKKTAHRLLIELKIMFDKDETLKAIAFSSEGVGQSSLFSNALSEARDALYVMGFTEREVEVALRGCSDSVAGDAASILGYALKRMGGGSCGK